MAEHAWTLLCRRAILDHETHIPFVIEIIQKISVPKEDSIQDHGGYIDFPMQIFGLWLRSDSAVPESVVLRLRILLPTGEYSEVKSESDEDSSFILSLLETTSARPRIKLAGVPWAGLGLYWFVLEQQKEDQQWRIVARVPIELEAKKD